MFSDCSSCVGVRLGWLFVSCGSVSSSVVKISVIS